MEEKNIIQEKDSNKTIKSILYIIIFSIAAIGIILASTGYDFEFNKYDKYYDEEYYEDDDYYDDEEDYYYDDEEDEETSESNPESEGGFVNVDVLLKDSEITVNYDDKLELVKSSNIKKMMSNELVGEMYKDQISNEYKLLYTISFLHNKIDESLNNSDRNYKIYQIKKETLLKYARMLFYEVEIPETLNSALKYNNIYNLTCPDDTCNYFTQNPQLLDFLNDGYEAMLYERGDQIIVDTFYVEYDDIHYADNDNQHPIADITIKEKFDGNIIKKLEDYELKLSENLEDYNENAIFYDLINQINESTRYIFTFNDQNVLISVEKE